MNTDEERQRAVAAIDAQIVALIEDGVPADASRIRALKAKRAVAQKSKKAIKRSVRKARERHAAAAVAAAVAPAKVPPKTDGRITLVPDSAADSKRLRSLPDKERKRIETARMEVRQTLTWCEEPSAEGFRNAIARCDAEISALIDRGVDYEADARTMLRNRRARLKTSPRPSPPGDVSRTLRSSSWPTCWTHTWNGAARSAEDQRTSSECSTCDPAAPPPWASGSRPSLTRSSAASR
ncbi:UNVERIFIED_ORG: hypothetical protein EDC92_110168 [Dietzia maris]|uniref:hypothetical protein n=1 Tax=Dietzia maris TaxID=37915 RepID=UPI001047A6DF